ncbi:MAG: FecR domain-containing protein [Pseudomonadota bacterium]
MQLRLPHVLIVLIALLIAIIPLAPSFAKGDAGSDDSVRYTVEPGDTLIDLARDYFRQPQDYRAVQKLNRIANPRRIPVGMILTIPYDLLKYRQETAQVAAFRGMARISADGQGARMPELNQTISEGTGLATGAASSLSLAVSDGSILTMPSNSVMRITRLRRIILTDSLDFEYALDKGALRSIAAPARNSEDRFRVRTPSAVSAVRGTDFRTRFDDGANRSFAELVEGGLDVSASSGDSARLEPGFGATIGAAGLNTEPLLTAPEVAQGSGIQRDPQLTFRVDTLPSASAYRLQIARDSSFIDIVEDVQSDGTSFTLDALEDGNYFAKFTAIAASGLEGLPANIAFRRRLNSVSGSAGPSDDGFLFRWLALGSGERRYRLQIFADNDAAQAPIVDEAGLVESGISLSDLPAGEYRWRVGTIAFFEGESEQVWTEFQTLRIDAD